MAQAPKATASAAIGEIRNFTRMFRALMALEEELGDLSNLEKARSARQGDLSTIEGQIREKETILANADAAIAKATEASKAAHEAVERDIAAARAAVDVERARVSQAGKDIIERADAAKAEAAEFVAKCKAEAMAAAQQRDRALAEEDRAKQRINDLKAELQALRNRMSV